MASKKVIAAAKILRGSIRFNVDYFQLNTSEVSNLISTAKMLGYKPKNASSSPYSNFYYKICDYINNGTK